MARRRSRAYHSAVLVSDAPLNAHRNALVGIAVVLLLAPAGSARADWYAEGVRVAVGDGAQTDAVVATDGAGGAFIAWQDGRSGTTTIWAQHLTANGSTASGWPIEGIRVSTSYDVDPVIVSDGRGGAFVAATNGGSIGLWHLSSGPPSGAIATLARIEPRTALPADVQKTVPTVLPVLLPDGDGGVFLAWEGGYLSERIEVRHFTEGGQSVPPGSLLGYGYAPTICSDGAGGLFVTNTNLGLTVQHIAVSPDSVVTAWPSWVPVTSPHGYQDAPGIVSDNAGGALVFWQDPRVAGQEQVYAQRLTESGAVAEGWPADGLPICTFPTDAGLTRYSASSRSQRYSVVATDGAGGAFVAWRDQRADLGDVYLQHVLPDGSLAAGWTANGVAVCRTAGIQQAPCVAGDGTGGAFVCWQDQRSSASGVFVQHVLASGSADPAWPSDGAPACADPSNRFLPRLIATPGQGPLLAWQDSRLPSSAIFATRLQTDGSLAPVGPCYVQVSVVSAVADSGTIHIVWQLAHADTETVTLYCRQVDGPWTPIERRYPDASGRIDYADREGLEGCRYGYALGIGPCGAPEQMLGVLWIDVPIGHGFPSLTALPRQTLLDGGPLRLTWEVPGAEGLQAIVSSRDSCSSWANVDTLTVPESGEVVYDEAALFDGHSKSYRLQIHACGKDNVLPEWWVTVPAQGFIPTDAALVRATADAEGAHLAWQMRSGPPSRAHIYRRSSSSWWSLVRDDPVVAGETIAFADGAVHPATRYEYCIGIASCGAEPIFGEVVIHTPAILHAPVALALRGGWPNPSRAGLVVSFSLTSAEPARLEVFDTAGRLVTTHSVGDLGPGDHTLALEASPRKAGVYVVRLSQSGRSVSTRVTLLR